MNRKEQEAEECIRWIQSMGPWETFWTGTTRYAASRDGLLKSFRKFMREEFPTVSYVCALEPHKDINTGFHIHCLFDREPDWFWKRGMQKKWFDRYGRHKIEKPRSEVNVQQYVIKYVFKDTEVPNFTSRETSKTIYARLETTWDIHLSRHKRRQLGMPTKNVIPSAGDSGSTDPMAGLLPRGSISEVPNSTLIRESFDWKAQNLKGWYRYRRPKALTESSSFE